MQNTFDFEYFWRLGNKEVDFVEYKDNLIQAIEVKYTSKIQKEDVSGIQTFSTKFKTTKKLIISKDVENKIDDIEVKSFYNV